MQSHQRWRSASIAVGFLVATVLSSSSEARLVALVVEQQGSFVGGIDWGDTGPYERLLGTAYMEVDPRDPLNALIVDLDNAPKNVRGMVEFGTRFMIVKPVDMSRGNQKIYYRAGRATSSRRLPTSRRFCRSPPSRTAARSSGGCGSNTPTATCR